MFIRNLLILVTLCSFAPASAGQPAAAYGDSGCPYERAEAEALARSAEPAPAVNDGAAAAASLFNASRSAPALIP